MKILLLDFSPKAMEGNCASMAQFLLKAYPMHTYTLVHVAKEGIEPCGQCQYRCLVGPDYACECPDASRGIYELTKDVDLIYYFIPVFSDYPCAYYFMFRERGQSVVNDHMASYSQAKKRFIFVANTGKENLEKIVKSEPGQDKSYIVMSTQDYKTKGVLGDLMQYAACQDKLQSYFEKDQALGRSDEFE
mgnify:FL=1